jgi:signal transduction histidine kinase
LDSPGRLEVLDEVGVLPGVADEMFDPYARLVARLLDVPVALVSFVGLDRQVFASSSGLPEPYASRGETPIELSFCQHVIRSGEALIVEEAPTDPRVRHNPAIGELGVQAYLGTPLRAPGGEPLGSLCAIDHVARTWSDDDLASLRDVADAVETAIALRISEHRQRSYAGDASHQLRSPITALRLELEDLAGSPEVGDGVRESLRVAGRHVEHLSDTVDDLLHLARSNGRLRDSAVDLVALASDVVERWRPLARGAGRDIVLEEAGPSSTRTVGPLVCQILDALVDDALAHGQGQVSLRPLTDGGVCRIRVSYEGRGVSTESRRGPVLAAELARRIGGRLSLTPAPSTTFELVLPPASAPR